MTSIRRDGNNKVFVQGVAGTGEAVDLTPVLKRIGVLVSEQFRRGFRDQRGASPWQARGVPNILGIIEDANQGSMPKARRFQSRPALVDTGRLRDSITSRVEGDSVTVGTAVPYASLMQGGGTVTKRLNRTGAETLASWARREKSDEAVKLAVRLSRKRSHTAQIPPRSIVYYNSEIGKIIADQVKGALTA